MAGKSFSGANDTTALTPLLSIAKTTKVIAADASGNEGTATVGQIIDLSIRGGNVQSGASYTFAIADMWNVVERSSAAAQTITVPPNSSVAFPVGTVLMVEQTGAGALTIAAGSGVTINKKASKELVLEGRYCIASLRKTGTDTWTATGNLVDTDAGSPGSGGGGGSPTSVPIPSGLGWTPTDFAIYALNGAAYTDFSMSSVKPTPDYIYYCSPTGSASASPGSNDPNTPVTPRRLVDLANAHGGNIKAFLAGGIYYGNKGFDGNTLTCASMTLEPWAGQGTGRPIFVRRNTNAAATFTLDQGTTYYVTHSTAGTSAVFDLAVKNASGCYTRLPYAADLAACRATPGTCFYDSAASRMYVNTSDGRNLIGSTDLMVLTNGRCYSHIRADNSVTWMKGVDFLGGVTLQQATTAKTGKFYAEDCGFFGGDGSSTGSLAITGPVDVRLIQCKGGGGVEDSFNYHGNAAGNPVVLEDRCAVIRSGYNTAGTNNSDTIHETGKLISVSCVYEGAQNRTIHNINGSKSFYVYASVGASIATDSTGVTIVAGSAASGHSAEIWLYGIGSGGIANSSQGGFYAYPGCAIRYSSGVGNFTGITTASGSGGTIGSYTP